MKHVMLMLFVLGLALSGKSQDAAIPELPFMEKPYFFMAEGGDLIALEEGIFTSMTEGKTTTIYFSKLSEAALVIPEWTELRMLIDSKNEDIAEIELHRLDVIEYGRGYVLKGKKAMEQLNDRRVSIKFNELENGLIDIVPAGPLLPGHYGIAIYQKSYTFEIR